MDVGIIMDRSGSVGSANFLKSKNFVRTLVHRLQISSHGTRVGIIAYQSSAHLAVKFSDVHAQTPSAMSGIIDKISYTGGGTRTDIALEMANSGLFSSGGGDRGDKPNVLVVISDGKTNRGSKAYSTVLRPLIVSMLFFILYFAQFKELPQGWRIMECVPYKCIFKFLLFNPSLSPQS